MKIAFIGLGTMGRPMAGRLAEQFDVSGWDLSEEARAGFAAVVPDLQSALTGAEVVITMLPEGSHVAGVYNDAVFGTVPSGALLIDCSTIDVETTRALAADARRSGLDMLDAPVSGGAEGAAVGTLSFMVGGNRAAYERALPVLEIMGSKVTHFGEAGTGQAAKACHNMICGITALGVCEAFALAEGLGLDPDRFSPCARALPRKAGSWKTGARCPARRLQRPPRMPMRPALPRV